MSREFFTEIVDQARGRGLLSDEHFSVDGTLLDAWASMKSFRPKGEDVPPPGDGGRNRAVDFRGERRVNETHESRTDSDARLARRGPGKEARLCYEGHVLMDNRQGLVVDVKITEATGTSERDAALDMLQMVPSGDSPCFSRTMELATTGTRRTAGYATCSPRPSFCRPTGSTTCPRWGSSRLMKKANPRRCDLGYARTPNDNR